MWFHLSLAEKLLWITEQCEYHGSFVHLYSDMWLVFLWVSQDLLPNGKQRVLMWWWHNARWTAQHSPQLWLAYELHLFSLCMLFFLYVIVKLNQLCFFLCPCQKMTFVVSVSKVFQQDNNQQNCKYDPVVDRITIYAYVYCTMVMAVFLLAHPCLSTCLLNSIELLLTGFLSKPVYL